MNQVSFVSDQNFVNNFELWAEFLPIFFASLEILFPYFPIAETNPAFVFQSHPIYKYAKPQSRRRLGGENCRNEKSLLNAENESSPGKGLNFQ